MRVAPTVSATVSPVITCWALRPFSWMARSTASEDLPEAAAHGARTGNAS
jgi:hypothetical protein